MGKEGKGPCKEGGERATGMVIMTKGKYEMAVRERCERRGVR